MVDELPKIDKPLFQTQVVKKVRETSKRPQERRTTRDTYSESDELALLNEAERLERDKAKRKDAPESEKGLAQDSVESDKDKDEEGEVGAKKKRLNIIV